MVCFLFGEQRPRRRVDPDGFSTKPFRRVGSERPSVRASFLCPQLASSIRKRKHYAKAFRTRDVSHYIQIQKIDRSAAGISYLQFELSGPALIVQVLEASFLLLLDLYC